MQKSHEAKPERSAKEQMIRGSAWMTIGSVLSRVLGAIYVVPWRVWLGGSFLAANVLFTKGYQIYAIFLAVATAGVPDAIAKQVAHYNAMNEYKTGLRLFYHGAIAMMGMGVLAFGLMWGAAPWLALHDPDLTGVFRSLAWPLLFIPSISIIRGFFQGYNEMAPSAISQFVEQVARVIYMLVMTFIIMKLGSGDYVAAATQSTFAAFIGAVAALAVLLAYLLKERPRLHALASQGEDNLQLSVSQILIDIVRQAIPFIVLNSAINLYYIIDQYSFEKMLRFAYIVSADRAGHIYAMFAGNANKLIMIVVSLAVAMAATALPLLAAAKTKNDVEGIANQVTNVIQMFYLVMIPAAFGMWAIAQPLYVVFYGYDAMGIKLLEITAILAILLGLFTVLATVLQGLFHNRLAMRYMFVGLAVKLVAQWPMIYSFGVYGATVATMMGTGISILLILATLRTRYHYRARQTFRRLLGITGFSIVMALVVRIGVALMSQVLNPASSLQSLLMIAVVVPIGGMVYAYAVLKTRLADYILSSRIGALRRKLGIK